ncbi:MAG: zf-TFIIB domain-containing protein [Candidatus Paceibacterota bacterium]|jgi:hypothetical protein
MKCPICNVDLLMSDRQGVEIDYCPQCRGVWLDRGELDKIIERNQSAAAPAVDDRRTVVQPKEAYQAPREEYYKGSGKEHDDHDDGYKKKKKGGLLGEIFDF